MGLFRWLFILLIAGSSVYFDILWTSGNSIAFGGILITFMMILCICTDAVCDAIKDKKESR